MGASRLTIPNMQALLRRLEAVGQAALVTIESVVSSFCDGLDVQWVERQEYGRTPGSVVSSALECYRELLTSIETTPVPVIALVNGPALGGGLGLVAAADLVIASPHATFAFPEALMGLIPAVAFAATARRIGSPHTRFLALSGKPLSAADALRLGLVDEIAEDVEVALAAYAKRFLRMDRRALSNIKTLVSTHYGMGADYYADASSRFADLWNSRETRKRMTRFAGGQTPWSDEGDHQ
jgi:enoyl-CoA hydratase/carnithine racemase